MKLTVISHAPHIEYDQKLWSYGPYVREMNLWTPHFDSVKVVAPLASQRPTAMELSYDHGLIELMQVPSLFFKSGMRGIRSVLQVPSVMRTIYKAFKTADHIHLRCPGNIGLLGCMVQIFFPRTIKTAKYAGNWDPNGTNQPLSYRLQKWILANPWLTRNMQVMAYGEWPNQSPNIKPFFTATYSEKDTHIEILRRDWQGAIKFVFAGTLSEGKNPFYAVQLIKGLKDSGINVHSDIYGDGVQKKQIQDFITEHHLEQSVVLHGNKDADRLKNAYQNAHFLILPSQSEGWPKVVAEAMFWGAIPITRAVSCVPWMLGHGDRGILLKDELTADVQGIMQHLNKPELLQAMSQSGADWSRQYTTDAFSKAIKQLLAK